MCVCPIHCMGTSPELLHRKAPVSDCANGEVRWLIK